MTTEVDANYDEVICPNCVTQFRAIPVNVQIEISEARSSIERLENEALAATIRMDNDAMEVARLTPLQYRQAPCHKFCESTAYEVEIRALKAERSSLASKVEGLTREQVGLALDAARYQTLLEKALYALEYASDMTKPEGLSGCDCPVCTVIGEIEAMKEAK
jgi:hypothetical protein